MKKLLSKKNSFDAIKKNITPKVLTKCVSNSLLMGMKVSSRSDTRTFDVCPTDTFTTKVFP